MIRTESIKREDLKVKGPTSALDKRMEYLQEKLAKIEEIEKV